MPGLIIFRESAFIVILSNNNSIFIYMLYLVLEYKLLYNYKLYYLDSWNIINKIISLFLGSNK